MSRPFYMGEGPSKVMGAMQMVYAQTIQTVVNSINVSDLEKAIDVTGVKSMRFNLYNWVKDELYCNSLFWYTMIRAAIAIRNPKTKINNILAPSSSFWQKKDMK